MAAPFYRGARGRETGFGELVSQDRQRQWHLRTKSIEKVMLHLDYSGFEFTKGEPTRSTNSCLGRMLALQRQDAPFVIHTKHRTDQKRVVCIAWVPGEKCGVRDLKKCLYAAIEDDAVSDALDDDDVSTVKLIVVSRIGETDIAREAANEVTKDNSNWRIEFKSTRRLARHCNNMSD